MTDEAHEQSINSLNSGISMYRDGCLAGAISNFRTAVDIDPDHAAAWIRLGNALLERRQLLSDLENLKEDLRADPNDNTVRYKVARMLFLLGFEADAESECRRLARSGSVVHALAARKMLQRCVPHDADESIGIKTSADPDSEKT